jgi:hypothetical protein
MILSQLELDQDYALALPKVGDSELREIVFKHPDVELLIWLSWNNQMLRIMLKRPAFFAAETDHMQNVIDKIFIYPDRESAKSIQKIASVPRSETEKILKIEPISGIDLLCVAEDITFDYRP